MLPGQPFMPGAQPMVDPAQGQQPGLREALARMLMMKMGGAGGGMPGQASPFTPVSPAGLDAQGTPQNLPPPVQNLQPAVMPPQGAAPPVLPFSGNQQLGPNQQSDWNRPFQPQQRLPFPRRTMPLQSQRPLGFGGLGQANMFRMRPTQ